MVRESGKLRHLWFRTSLEADAWMPVSDGRGNATQLGHEAGFNSSSVRLVGRPQTPAPCNDRKVQCICASPTGAMRRKSRATQISLSLWS